MAKISSRVKNLHRKIAQSNLRLFAKLDEDSKANKDVRLHALQEVKSLIEDKSDVKSPELQTQMQNLKDKIIAKFDSTPSQMVS